MASKCLQRHWKAGNALKENVVLTGRRSRWQRFREYYRTQRAAELQAQAERNRDLYLQAVAPRRKRSFFQRAADAIRRMLS